MMSLFLNSNKSLFTISNTDNELNEFIINYLDISVSNNFYLIIRFKAEYLSLFLEIKNTVEEMLAKDSLALENTKN